MKRWKMLTIFTVIVVLGFLVMGKGPPPVEAGGCYLVLHTDNYSRSQRMIWPVKIWSWVCPDRMVEASVVGPAERVEVGVNQSLVFGPDDMVLFRSSSPAYADGRVIPGRCFTWRAGGAGVGSDAFKNPPLADIAGFWPCGPPAEPPPPGYPLSYPGQPTQTPEGCYYDGDGNLVCPPPPGYPPPPSQPSTTAGWTYQSGQNVRAGWTSITASANELVAVTTGPATHRGHSFPGGVDRGTILIFAGAVSDSVYLPFGGWVGRYTSPNPSGAWSSLLDDRISAMRRWDNCSTGYGCRWLDLLVVGSGGYTIYGPVLRGPYY